MNKFEDFKILANESTYADVEARIRRLPSAWDMMVTDIEALFTCYLSQIEPKEVDETLGDPSWIDAMQEELDQFKGNDV